MWSHYSNSHSGFCVGFNSEKIIDKKYFSKCSKVDYSMSYPKINPIKWNENDMDTDFVESSTKYKSWEYEEEVRFIKIFTPYEDTSKEVRTIIIENEIINNVTIGLNISPEYEIQIKEICLRKKIPLYKTRKSERDFKLERFRII